MRRAGRLLMGCVAAVVAFATPLTAHAEDDLFTVGARAFHEGSYAATIGQLTTFLRQHPHAPTAADAHRMLGRSYFVLGRYPEALVELKQALGPPAGPQTAEGLYWLGEALLKNQDEGAARDTFQQVLDQFPGSPYAPFALYSIAWTSRQQGQWDEAAAQFTAVVQQFPEDPLRIEAQFLVGECLVRRRHADEAVSWLKEFITTHPVAKYVPQAYFLLGQALTRQHQFDEAIACYQKSIGAAPRGPWAPLAQAAIGLVWFAQQDYPRSAQALAGYLERYPRGPLQDLVQFHLARALVACGQPTAAVESLTHLIQHAPESPWADDALLLRAELWYRQGRLADAALGVRQLIEQSPASPVVGDALYLLAWIHLALNDPTTAARTFERAAGAAATARQRASALALAGDLLLDQGNGEAALRHYDQILQHEGDTAYAEYAQYRLGAALFVLGRLDAAKLAFEALLTQYPTSRLKAAAHLQCGLSDLALDRPDAAQQQFRAMLADDDLPAAARQEAQYYLGTALALLGDHEGAMNALRLVIRMTPSTTELHQAAAYQLGWAADRAGQSSEALRFFHDYLAGYPRSTISPDLAVWLARYYQQHGQPAQATHLLTTLSARLKRSPAAPMLQYWLGRTWLDAGDHKKAITHLTTALQTAPDHPLAVECIHLLEDAARDERDLDEVMNVLKGVAHRANAATTQSACWGALGHLTQWQGQYHQAIRYFRQGLAVTPDAAALQYPLASCYEALGRWREALSLYNQVARLDTEEGLLASVHRDRLRQHVEGST